MSGENSQNSNKQVNNKSVSENFGKQIFENHNAISKFICSKNISLLFIFLFLILNASIFFFDSIFINLIGLFAVFVVTISTVHLFLSGKQITANFDFLIAKYSSLGMLLQLIPVILILSFAIITMQEMLIPNVNFLGLFICFCIIYCLLIFIKFNIIFVSENLKNINIYNFKKIIFLFKESKIYYLVTFFVDALFLSAIFFIHNKYLLMIYSNFYYFISLYLLLSYANIYKISSEK